jgi:hypothetical protein
MVATRYSILLAARAIIFPVFMDLVSRGIRFHLSIQSNCARRRAKFGSITRCFAPPLQAQCAATAKTPKWQSILAKTLNTHGFHQCRKKLQKLSKDDNHKMVVIDPRRSESADIADMHLAVKNGTDAWMLAALLPSRAGGLGRSPVDGEAHRWL